MDDDTPEKPPRERHDGWTKARQEEFLDALKAQGTVAAACAAVGMATTSAYKARQRIRGFRNRWDDALAQVKPKVEQEVMRRAVEGWEEPVFQGGKQVGVKRRYSDSLLRMMALRGTTVPEQVVTEIDLAEVERVLMRRLEVVDRQARKAAEAARAAERAAAVAWAEDMLRRGLCP